MHITFKPSSKDFTGEIVLRAPTFDERYRYRESMIVDGVEEGVTMGRKAWIEGIRRAVKASESHYEKVDIKHKDGKVFDSFESLSFDPRAESVLIEAASTLLNGQLPND